MQLSRLDFSADERDLISSFALWLLDIEDGNTDNGQGLSKLIDFIYDQNTLRTPFVCETTIYLSHDEATPLERDRAKIKMLYPIEHLNTLKFPGFPPYQLELKVGAPLMLLRNVNVAGGLCNNTRMIVRQIFLRTFHCMLLDREGNAIHANMNLKDIDFFNPKLQMDYIGCVRAVGDLIPFGDPNRTQSTRKIEIETSRHIRDSGTALMTFFSPAADKITKHPCQE
ncbi:DNA helicase [Tanacetum coccineum]